MLIDTSHFRTCSIAHFAITPPLTSCISLTAHMPGCVDKQIIRTLVAMALDGTFVNVELNEEDVPGSSLCKEVEKCSVLELKRWLQCRGLKISGSKQQLINR